MKHKYLFIFLFVWLFVCLYLFHLIYNEAEEKAINDLNARQVIHASQAKISIEEFFKNAVTELTKISESDNVIDLNNKGRQEIEFALKISPEEITAITRVDKTGKIIYTAPYVEDVIGKDISYQKHIQKVFKNKTPVVSDVFKTVQGYRAVALHVPVFKNNELKGSLAVLINFLAISKRFLEEIRLGDTGYAWMISQKGIELYCPVPGHIGNSVFENCKEFPTIITMANDMMKGGQGVTTYVFDRIRDKKLETIKKHAVYLPIELADTFWSIVVASSEDEILAALVNFKNRLIFILVLLLTGSFLFSYYGVKSWGIVREQTDRKRAEEELEQIFTMSLDLICIADINTSTFLKVNPAFTEILGYSEEELLARPFSSFIHPDDIESTNAVVEEKLQMGSKVINFDNRYRCKDGTYRWLSWVSYPNPEKKITYAIARDITDWKKTNQELEESKALLESTGRLARVGGWELDAETKTVSWTKETYRIHEVPINYQVPLEEAINFFHPDDRERLSQAIHSALQDGEPYDLEIRFITAKGRQLWTRTVCKPHVEEGEVVKLRGAIQNITERKKLEERIQQSQKMESIGSLAGGIAHDFNNILFPIVGMAELLLEDLPPASMEYENAEEILKAGHRGSDLVKQILAFSRQAEHKKIPVRAQSVLKEVLKLTRSTIPSDININQDIQPDCGLIMADPTQIHQVAMNLITNAYHALEADGGEISVHLKEKVLETSDLPDPNLEPGKHVILSVSDTGKGVPPENIGKIFDPYFTTKEQGKGTGLGLAVVHGIVREHGGAVKVYSEKGKGSTFYIYLPLMDKADTSDPIEMSEVHPLGNERILLVDDEESIARLEKQMLERLGYKVTGRNSSPDALEAFQSNPDLFDLVITDMTMPNMTGDQLARELRTIRPDIPVIICTGFSDRINQEKAKLTGIKGFLMKPIVKLELAQMVRDVLDEPKG